jgi:hypothetical protein
MPRHVFLSIVLFLLALGTPSRSEAYHWPMDAPRALTSTFAEYRAGHLHSGIDLKTWGEVGREVYAVRDGYVWRVKASPWGYGKALYVRLVDGKIAVYGHLLDFVPTIQKFVEEEQTRVGRYSVDLYLKPGQIPVREGQLVGHSGRTGCAHPHLHFELRDGEHCPLNPLQHGFSVADHRAPYLTALSIQPLDWRSAVEGRRSRRVYPMRWDSQAGRYQLSSIPLVEGRVGLSLAVHDLADGAQNRLNVHALSLFLDGQRIFSAIYDRFPFSATDKADLDIDFSLYREGRGIYHNLYVAQGNDLPFYEPDGFGCGIIDAQVLDPGHHRIRIRAEDFWGNVGEAEFSLLLDQRPSLEDLRISRDSAAVQLSVRAADPDGPVQKVVLEVSENLGRHWQPLEVAAVPGQEHLYRALWRGGDNCILVRAWGEDQFGVCSHPKTGSVGTLSGKGDGPEFEWHLEFFHDSVELSISSDRMLAQEPRVMINQMDQGPRTVPLYSEGLRQYRGLAPLMPGSDGMVVVSITGRDLEGHLGATAFSFPLSTITRSGGGRVADLGGRVEALFEPGSVYQAFVSYVEEVEATSPPGLPLKSPAFFFYPDDRVFQGRATISMLLPETEKNQRIGLYRLNQQGDWSFIGHHSGERHGAIEARVRSFSTFALLEDQVAPLIWRVRPEDGSPTKERCPVLSAKVRDVGSGIGREEDVVMILDGQILISQYDPPIEAVFFRSRESLALGQHLLEVVVRDRAGNESRAQSHFHIIP